MGTTSNTQLLLQRWREGEGSARDRLIAHLMPELKQIAASRLRRENNTSLSSGDLINDAVLRILQATGEPPENRAHFIALSSRLMRHILIDHARQKSASKRQHVKVTLCTQIDGPQRLDLISLDSALIRLGVIDPQLMELVEMRYFGGMTIEDISVVTGWSTPTINRRWATARAWLADALSKPIDDV